MNPISIAWEAELKRQKLTLKAGRGPRQRVGNHRKQEKLLYGRWWPDTMNEPSIYGQEFYTFPDLDPAIEAVRLMDIYQARRKVYVKLGARIKPLRCTPRRARGSGAGTKVNLTDHTVVGHVPATSNFRQAEREFGRAA